MTSKGITTGPYFAIVRSEHCRNTLISTLVLTQVTVCQSLRTPALFEWPPGDLVYTAIMLLQTMYSSY